LSADLLTCNKNKAFSVVEMKKRNDKIDNKSLILAFYQTFGFSMHALYF